MACASCGRSLESASLVESVIGLAFDVPGKLRVTKRLAICTHVDGDVAHLHLSSKDKGDLVVPVASLTSPTDAVPASLSPATRLIYATRQPAGASKASWDATVLLARAAEVAATSAGAMRMVADEAIVLGWPDIVAWTTLSESEKTWRQAHQAAAAGDLALLVAELGQLPPMGYHARVALVLPHLQAVAAHPGSLALIESWQDAGLPGASQLHQLVQADWDQGLVAGIELLGAVAPARVDAWTAALEALRAGRPGAPLVDACPVWETADLVRRGYEGTNLDGSFERIAWVAPSIIDDLIDAGTVTSELATGSAQVPHLPYVIARLRPDELADEVAAAVGHHTELARRYCRHRDRARLDALPRTPGVLHYQALLDLLDGSAPDPGRLRAESVALLELAARASAALKERTTEALPGPVVADPTLWTMFAGHAQIGRLSPDADTRTAHPEFAHWCDLQRLVGLLWEERWADAVAFGEKLTAVLDSERQEDEALSLTAYALLRLDRGDEALVQLERAMAGSYTEALLVNLSVVASQARPEVAARYFARIVNEAPNRELQIAALRRAVDVWGTSGADVPEFPPELVEPYRIVLSGDCEVADYASFMSMAASVIPKVVLGLPDPGDERAPIYRLQRARARFSDEASFGFKDLALEFIAVHRQVGRRDWFDAEWKTLVAYIRDSVFVEFGKAPGSAQFIDTVIVNAPELFTQHERFILVPQAGAHLAARFVDTQDTLSDEAMMKFFYQPIEEFLSERSKIESGTVELIADNLHRTIFVAGMHRMSVLRARSTEPYNQLAQRLRWDSQNRFTIIRQMRSNLDDDAANQEEADRVLDRLQRLAVDTDSGREHVQAFDKALADWRAETVRLRANL